MEELDEVGDAMRDIRRDMSQELRSLEERLEAPTEPAVRPDAETQKGATPPPAEEDPKPPED
jgi:hypothetical protein